MQSKSAKQIQAEIELMRLAYRDREARLQNLNRFLANHKKPCHLEEITPYLISIAIMLSLACWILGLLISR